MSSILHVFVLKGDFSSDIPYVDHFPSVCWIRGWLDFGGWGGNWESHNLHVATSPQGGSIVLVGIRACEIWVETFPQKFISSGQHLSVQNFEMNRINRLELLK